MRQGVFVPLPLHFISHLTGCLNAREFISPFDRMKGIAEWLERLLLVREAMGSTAYGIAQSVTE